MPSLDELQKQAEAVCIARGHQLYLWVMHHGEARSIAHTKCRICEAHVCVASKKMEADEELISGTAPKTECTLPRTIYPRDMKLGDVVSMQRCADEIFPFHACIVKRIEPDDGVGAIIRLWRPYGITADFETVSGHGKEVICYTGIEEYTVFATSGIKYWLHERKELK